MNGHDSFQGGAIFRMAVESIHYGRGSRDVVLHDNERARWGIPTGLATKLQLRASAGRFGRRASAGRTAAPIGPADPGPFVRTARQTGLGPFVPTARLTALVPGPILVRFALAALAVLVALVALVGRLDSSHYPSVFPVFFELRPGYTTLWCRLRSNKSDVLKTKSRHAGLPHAGTGHKFQWLEE